MCSLFPSLITQRCSVPFSKSNLPGFSRHFLAKGNIWGMKCPTLTNLDAHQYHQIYYNTGSLGLAGSQKVWSAFQSRKILLKKQLLGVVPSIVSSALSAHEKEIKQACEEESKGEVFFMLWAFS